MAAKFYYVANVRLPTEKAHGVQIMKMCEALSRAGVPIELVVPLRFNEIKEDPFVYYGVERIFTIKKLRCFDTVRFGKVGYWIELLTFTIHVVMNTFFNPGIFYTRDEFVALSLRLAGKKRVVWEGHMGQKNSFIKLLIKMNIPFVLISQGLQHLYTKMGHTSERILVAHDAVDLDHFNNIEIAERARVKLGVPLDKKLVLYVGLLDEWKGYQTLLTASELLPHDIHVGIIGGHVDQIKILEKKYPQVTFIGFKPYQELPSNQQAADVLIIPNSGRTEMSKCFTSPLKLFAHMASGVPIIASNLPSLREVLDDRLAYFFTPDDPRNLADSIVEVLKHPEQGKEKARLARQKVEEYTWIKRAQKILHFIDQ